MYIETEFFQLDFLFFYREMEGENVLAVKKVLLSQITTKHSPGFCLLQKKRKRKEVDIEFIQEPPRKSTRQKTTTNGAPHPTPAASPSPPPPGSVDEAAVDVPDQNLYTANPAALTTNMDKWSWERVLCSDPEMLIRQASRQSEQDDENPLALQHRMLDERKQKESLVNPTPAMLKIIERMENREKDREAMTWQQQLQHLTVSFFFKTNSEGFFFTKSGLLFQGAKQKPAKPTWDLTPNLLTPAMEEVIAMRSKRVSVEIDVPITPDPSDSEDADSDSSDDSYSPPASMSAMKKAKKQASVAAQSFIRNYSSDSDEDDEPRTFNNPFMLLFSPSPKRPMTEREKELDQQFDNLLASPSPNKTVGERAKIRRRDTTTERKSSSVQVSVHMDTPEKIRNKDSPVKAAELAAKPPPCQLNKTKRCLNFQDVSLSHINTSPPTNISKRKTTKIREKFVTESDLKCAKRTSAIPENVFIETTRELSENDDEVTLHLPKRRRTSAAKKPKKVVPEKKMTARLKKPNSGRTKEPARRNMRSNSSNARETRAHDWNWADILLSHPEKVAKRGKAKN